MTVYASITTIPPTQAHERIEMIPCIGVILISPCGSISGSGEKFSSIIGFTASLIIETPVSISGLCSTTMSFSSILSPSTIMSVLMVSELGIRLIALSMENGQIRRTATILQSRTVIHFGAFFSNNLKSNTASTIQLADILIFTISRKKLLIFILLSLIH